MAIEFIMPQLGLTMTEGTISKWLKAVGEAVSIGDLLVEVETEKITNQLESTAEGTLLEILVQEGEAVPVQTAIALIGKSGEIVNKSSADGERIKASPLAKKIAKEQCVDLAIVTGTGPDGRVVERDIVGYIERNKVKKTPLAAKMADEFGVDLSRVKKESRIIKEDVLALIAEQGATVAELQPISAVPLSGMRKAIAERMSMSWQNVPHVNMTAEVDMTAAVDLKAMLGAATGKKMSFTEIIIKCAAHALAEFKGVNASLLTDGILFHESINIGVAVALENGLIVPVVKNADKKNVGAIRNEISELSQKARLGSLNQDEIRGGTFTVTNLGMFGVDHFTPIINQPESAILGVCRVVERPVVVAGSIVVRPMMNLTLSFDHRLIDGAVGAQFLARVRQLLEQPLLLI